MSDHWKDFAKSPLVKHLIETPRLNFVDPAAATPAPPVTDTSILTPQPADGSQTRAIVRALAGHSFVLEGPPGTGKSQTITNMLSNAMRTGKRVLFVAEKQAALGVVHERLQAVGLGPYCLELHDRGTTPEALRLQLRTALEQSPGLDHRAFEMLEQDFAAAAAQLDRYRVGLHEPNEAGFSFADAYEELTQLGVGPVAKVPRDTMRVGFERLAELRRSLLDVDSLASVARVRPDHPWMLARGVEFEQLDRAELAAILAGLKSTAAVLRTLDDGVGGLVNSAATLEELRQLAALLAVQAQAGPGVNVDLPSVLGTNWSTELAAAQQMLAEAIAELTRDFAGHEGIVSRTDLGERASAVAEAADSGFLGLGKKGRVQKQLGDLVDVIGHRDDPARASERMNALARLSDAMRTAWSRVVALAASSALGDRMPLSSIDLIAFDERAEQVRRAAHATASGGPFGDAVRVWLAQGRVAPPGVADAAMTLLHHLERLARMVEASDESVTQWAAGRGVAQDVVNSVESAWAQDVDNGTYLELQRWLRLQVMLDELRGVSLADFAGQLERGDISGADAPNAFERGLLMTTMQMRAEELNLDVFDRGQHDQRVSRFIDLMTRRSALARDAIPFELSRSRKVTGNVNVGRVGDFRRYVSTPGKRRGKSIRHLVSTYPEIVSDLTPCFLMSPDSVAQFVPPGTVEFDIAVFDEASQITVADAIGVMGRAKSVVIVGDSKQMPPTRVGVFSGSDEDAPVELGEDFIEEESILEEVLQAGFAQEWLTWHYRSQDESLITFSNDHYYESRLASFPAPQRLRDGCGLRYRRVQGQFDHGGTRTNAIEAQAIVDELISRLDDPAYAGQTFGIITLNMQQRRLIEGLLDDHSHAAIRAMRETEDPEKRLFVLNLENVQGRERDVIFLGTSFSKRANGSAMPMNFGPLTQRGGEKRLNVAITRARRQLVVVSSFDPEELKDPSSLGMIHLKTFLERARELNRSGEDDAVVTSPAASSRFIGEIADRLRAEGLRVITGYGRSQFKVDLAISDAAHPDEWLVAVLVDGSEWASRPLASDRDALPTVILRNIMGWQKVVRVWLAAWRLEPDQIVADLVDMVAAAAKARDEGAPDSPPPPPAPAPASLPAPAGPISSASSTGSTGSGSLQTSYPRSELYVAFPDRSLGHLKDALVTLPPQATDALRALVAAEAPIFRDVALKKVAYMFGVGKVSAKMLAALQPLARGYSTTDLGHGVVLWSDRNAATWRGFRPSTKEQRDLFEVCPEELINAMTSIAEVSMGISSTELIRGTAQVFGVKALTDKAKQHLEPALDLALRQGRLVEEDGHLVPQR